VNKVEVVLIIIDVLIVEENVLEEASLADSCRGASKLPKKNLISQDGGFVHFLNSFVQSPPLFQ
jgi:hypothetical protein